MRPRKELSLVHQQGFNAKNEEVEVAFREYLGIRLSDLYRHDNFKLAAKWGKCITMLWGLC